MSSMTVGGVGQNTLIDQSDLPLNNSTDTSGAVAAGNAPVNDASGYDEQVRRGFVDGQKGPPDFPGPAVQALGISSSDLEGGKTLSEVASSKGISSTDLQAALVKDIQSGDKNVSDDRAAQMAKEMASGKHHGHHHHGHGIKVAADVLDMSQDDLMTQLKSGKTLSDIAGDKADTVQQAIQAEIEKRPNMTADKAAQMAQDIMTRTIPANFSGKPPQGGQA